MEKFELNTMGIHSLRGLARDLGVSAPTSKKKAELIELIKSAQKNRTNSNAKISETKRKGRPCLKNKVYCVENKSSELFNEILMRILILKEHIKTLEERLNEIIEN